MMREQKEVRALDAVGRCLIRRLIVPRIYYRAEWPGLSDDRQVDLLALDRDGVGDAHLVEIRHNAPDALALAPQLLSARAPFRWIAFFARTEDNTISEALVSRLPLHIPGQPGQLGVIHVVEMEGGELGAKVIIVAERFATPTYDLATTFSNGHEAQVQFGA